MRAAVGSARRAIFFLSIAWACASVAAQPLALDADARAAAQAAVRYAEILARLSARSRLDEDAALLERARRIAGGLIAAAAQSRRSSASWGWEVHVTAEPSVAAYCMAGGKILIGSGFVKRLDLSDGELAMLLGHEMAHALADHRRAEERSAMDADPAEEVRLARIANAQEAEADRIGMELAYRAGWPAASLVGFFEKLAADRGAGSFSSSHPSPEARIVAARALAAQLGP